MTVEGGAANGDPGTTRRGATPRLDASHLPVGQVFDLETYEMTREELVEFASAWDPQSFHLSEDEDAARHHGGLIASGIHTMAIYQRLCVRALFDRYDIVAGRELRSVRFLRPVRPGDVLTGHVEVLSNEPARPGRAAVELGGNLENQAGEVVLTTVFDVIVADHGTRPESAG